MAAWCSEADCVRLLVALGTLGAVFVLLLTTLLVGGDHSAMVTGLLAALSAVLAWYFGSQGASAADRRAAVADSGRLAIAHTAESAAEEVDQLRRQLRLAMRAIALARSVPEAQAKIDEVLEGVKE